MRMQSEEEYLLGLLENDNGDEEARLRRGGCVFSPPEDIGA
jgi:hypothetical protein